jgi:hypothetical protein
VNGGVSLLLNPETPAEEALLKQMMKQDNELTELRSTIVVMNKSFQPGGVLIGKRNKSPEKINDNGDTTQT